MYSVLGDAALPAPGFPIRRSTGQRLFSASPWLIAAVHVLLRLLVPRHPPCALTILTVSCTHMHQRVMPEWRALAYVSSASILLRLPRCQREDARTPLIYQGVLGLVQFSRSTEAPGRGSPAGVSEN